MLVCHCRLWTDRNRLRLSDLWDWESISKDSAGKFCSYTESRQKKVSNSMWATYWKCFPQESNLRKCHCSSLLLPLSYSCYCYVSATTRVCRLLLIRTALAYLHNASWTIGPSWGTLSVFFDTSCNPQDWSQCWHCAITTSETLLQKLTAVVAQFCETICRRSLMVLTSNNCFVNKHDRDVQLYRQESGVDSLSVTLGAFSAAVVARSGTLSDFWTMKWGERLLRNWRRCPGGIEQSIVPQPLPYV